MVVRSTPYFVHHQRGGQIGILGQGDFRAFPTQQVKGAVARDGEQPGQRRAAIWRISVRPLPYLHEGILQGVLRPGFRAQDTEQ